MAAGSFSHRECMHASLNDFAKLAERPLTACIQDLVPVLSARVRRQAAGLLALLRERCGEELVACLAAANGPAAASELAPPSCAADLATLLRPEKPDAKALKALLQQAVREARRQASHAHL